MPAVRTTPRDVLIRVPKVEPYSNSYLPPSIRAKALCWSGILALHQGEYRAAARALEESMAIFQQLGERHGVGNALNALGTLANQQLDPARASRLPTL